MLNDLNDFLTRVEAKQMWAYFHKDWLLEMRALIRPQLPREYSILIESETVLITPRISGVVQPSAPDIGIARVERPTMETRHGGRATAAVLEVEEAIELYQSYSLVIRRAPENLLIAAAEILSPTNKGSAGQVEKDKYLRKRAGYLESGLSFLEIDALVQGDRLTPANLATLKSYARNAWTAYYDGGRRRMRGWGWNAGEPLPIVDWMIEGRSSVEIDLAGALERAREFNPWESNLAPA